MEFCDMKKKFENPELDIVCFEKDSELLQIEFD
jgi:hypothetical protein